ncbi:MAG: DUF1553 domain-containing protein [Planctomycetota bacterium]|nr:DUF1553 domain-containing protein [Planctomycetota bacterium]
MNFFSVMMMVLAVEAAPVDFDTEIVPILTKAGCNAAACHGSATGRGGFKLSLFGGDPAWDYDEIVHRLEGRRINPVSADTSLVITKPTEQMAHEGGTRFEYDGPESALIAKWIEGGAARTRSRGLVRIEIEPRHSLVKLNDDVQLRVTATFDDDSQHDVTDLSVYTSSDPAAVAATDTGTLTILRRGRHHVVVRFLTDVQTVQVTAPLTDTPINPSKALRHDWVDEQIINTLNALHLAPSEQADDATLLRRISLHLTGRLPRADAVQPYLANNDPSKFSRLVDRLLDSDEFVEYWTYRLSKLLRIRPQPTNLPATQAFHGWVQQQLKEDRGWDQIAAELLLAEGDTHEYGPANFYLVTGDARAQAEYTSELLMGVRLSCANCHNHPLDRWTQDDYHGLAAIFARVERGRQVRYTTRGEVIHPATGTAAVARIPGERFLSEEADARQALAEWLTSDSNPYFARAMVNRIWKALMGRGLVEPTDDLRATNPATHPELLDRLASEFAANGHSLRRTMRTIVTSAAYARSSRATGDNAGDLQFYSHALSTGLEAEVLADAIADVTGIAEPYGSQPLGTRAIALFTPPESEALEILGRCDRSDSCEASESSTVGLTTKLHLLNGPLLNRRLRDEQGRLSQLLRSGANADQIIEDFYVAALSRYPSDEERSYWLGQLEGAPTEVDRPALEDFLWGLLNSQEFLTNH